MATIEKYISDLLHFHDCVIVPKLGGFVGNYKPASIMEERHLFLPPSKEIGFNRSLAHNDGLLIDFISRREGVSYIDASVKVNRFVVDVHERIASGEVIDLGDVGFLRRDAIGNLQFTPKEGSSFLPDALGLASFRFESLEQKRIIRIDSKEHVPQLLRSRSPRHWAAAAALIAGLFLFNTELKTPSVTEAGMNAFMATPVTVVENFNREVISNTVASELDTDLSTGQTQVGSMDEAYHLPVADLVKHHVIAASFKQSVPANKALDDFLRQGYSDAKLLDDGNGRIRVAIASFVNKQDALSALSDFRNQPRFESAWVLTSK